MRIRRLKLSLVTLAVGGMVLQAGSCVNFAVDSVLTSVEFCNILNCDGGTVFDFCTPEAILADCPNASGDGFTAGADDGA